MGYVLCAMNPSTELNVPKRGVESLVVEDGESTCRYYSGEMHKSAFVVPAFAAEVLGKK
jgi:spermidine synthase